MQLFSIDVPSFNFKCRILKKMRSLDNLICFMFASIYCNFFCFLVDLTEMWSHTLREERLPEDRVLRK
jgi:hypothetical protein